MKSRTYASIDIGSNAMRLLISTANFDDKRLFFKKNALVRVPIRLGQDVFTTGQISTRNQNRFLDAMTAFRHLMKVHEVSTYRACATSAMRDAKQSKELIERIKTQTDIDIEVIQGSLEAQIIFNTQIQDLLSPETHYLYVDVGGGSTELSLFHGKTLLASKSFNVGTIRLLNKVVGALEWKKLSDWISKYCNGIDSIESIASGGNINRTFKLIGKKKGQVLEIDELKDMAKDIRSVDYEERQFRFNMNPDRADVIVPALSIYLKIFDLAQIHTIHVPKIGLADGLIRIQHKNFLNQKT
ncbi:MAG: exopolyphosphatase [Flavobacteriales bacterium]